MTTSRNLQAGREAVASGRLVVYPTDTVYGIGCRADSDEGVDRLLEVTGRPPGRGLSVAFPDREAAEAWARWTSFGEELAEALLPGPVTLVLEASEKPAEGVVASQGTIGIRVVDVDEVQALAQTVPVVSTSANPAGQPPAHAIDEARDYFGDAVEAYVDAGRVTGSASTVVDARGEQPTVIRQGPVSEREIVEAMRRG
jgi:L-threonylcarbamoyladenylate synthase